MKKLLFSLSLLFFVSLIFTSCKKEEVIADVFTAEDLTHNYLGCPTVTTQRAMGKVKATSTKGTLTYSIVSQSLSSALIINANTGDISANDFQKIQDLYYDRDRNLRKLTLVVAVSNGSETKNVNVTINLQLTCV